MDNLIPIEERTFAFFGEPEGEQTRIANLLTDLMKARGHRQVAMEDTPKLAFHFIPSALPIEHLRRDTRNPTWTYSLSMAVSPECPGEREKAIAQSYSLQVRAHAPDGSLFHFNGTSELHHVTMELGHTLYRAGENQLDIVLWDFLDKFLPRAWAKMALHTQFDRDLPKDLWEGDQLTRELTQAGQVMESWGLLPAPFPLEDYLAPKELRRLRLMFGIGGLSYGNLSARTVGNQFWMSGTGVNKANLHEVGRDFLWVKGYDVENNRRLISIAPHMAENYPSVDLIEHHFIYTENPRVGAIVHIHGWIEDAVSTHVAYPCGSWELGRTVADLVKSKFSEDPECAIAVVGLKNHGLTVAGPDLSAIFAFLEGRVEKHVPMMT